MVKNTQGGSKHKSQARKLVNAPQSNKLRLPESDDECFAIVSKMLGNGMCHVNISYQNNILKNIVCHIRGKFRGRNKKANFVSPSSIILVGLRTWEKDISACDLMEIYSTHHIPKLNIDLLRSSINDLNHNPQHNDDFVFSNDNDFIQHSNTTSHDDHNIHIDKHDDIDFDLV